MKVRPTEETDLGLLIKVAEKMNQKDRATLIKILDKFAGKLREEIKKNKKDNKKRMLFRLLITTVGLVLIGIFIPKIVWGTTGLALIKEFMSGEHELIDKIQDIILGKEK
jgi:hypothetical protein